MAGIYGEDHENNINALFGPFRIASTAKKSADLENSKCSPRCWSRGRRIGRTRTVRQRGAASGKSIPGASPSNFAINWPR
jgi:hypothetical protein